MSNIHSLLLSRVENMVHRTFWVFLLVFKKLDPELSARGQSEWIKSTNLKGEIWREFGQNCLKQRWSEWLSTWKENITCWMSYPRNIGQKKKDFSFFKVSCSWLLEHISNDFYKNSPCGLNSKECNTNIIICLVMRLERSVSSGFLRLSNWLGHITRVRNTKIE